MSLALLAPFIVKLIPIAAKGVVRLVERVKGRGNGPTDKKPMAEELLGGLLRAIQADVPGLGLPQGGEVGQLVQDAWAALQSSGKLKGHETALEDDDTPEGLSKGTLLLCAEVLESEAARIRKAVA